MNRFQFVEDHKDAYGVKRLCEVIEVARSSFYAWLAAVPGRAARAAADAVLAAKIRVLQDPGRGGDRAYGAPRITADLNEGAAPGERVNHKRVARVMREHQLAGIRLRRRVRTTIPDQSGRRFPDLLGRDFSTGEPCRRYVGDITYLPIADGTNLYLATVIDLGSRKLAGWAMADHMRTELVEDALKAAWRERGSLRAAVFHSDHGPTPRRTTPPSASSWVCSSRWARSGRRRTTLSPSRSTRRSSASSSTPPPRFPTRQRHTGPCSGGSTATTPADGTPQSATSPRTPTRPPPPLGSRQRHKPNQHRVHDHGSRPFL